MPAQPEEPLHHVEDWVVAWAKEGAESLLLTGQATISTPRGTVEATMERPQPSVRGVLQITTLSDRGGSGVQRSGVPEREDEDLKVSVGHSLMMAVLSLVGEPF